AASTSLSSSITAAQTTADGKGKVIYSSTAPAAADRLAQNLWIDTTGGANTPKRWNGSAWVAVTDKVATDAAAAAATVSANLSNNYYTKADTDGAISAASTSLSSSITAAQTTADGKGKVIYSSTAPAAA
ncbi:hypothetical protein, partial [Cereibacter sediminicola]|uniref:hypothetical protein n=1 Tax=Cereibacter sediminicola TaxID=2584941 RepID=UPI001C92D9DF